MAGLANAWTPSCCPMPSYQSLLNGLSPATMPTAYTGGLGPRGVAALHAFAEAGGTLVALDSASELPLIAFGLPVGNVLAGVRDTEFSVPGSLLRLEVDTTAPLAWGVPAELSAFFANGLAFAPTTPRGRGEAETWPAGARVIALYGRGGLAAKRMATRRRPHRGPRRLVELQVGQGRVVLVGFRAQHRAQPHATFCFSSTHCWRRPLAPAKR